MTPFIVSISERPRFGPPSTSATLRLAFLSTVVNQVNENGISGYSSGCGRQVFIRCCICVIKRTVASVDIVLDFWDSCIVSHFCLQCVFGVGNSLHVWESGSGCPLVMDYRYEKPGAAALLKHEPQGPPVELGPAFTGRGLDVVLDPRSLGIDCGRVIVCVSMGMVIVDA